MQEISDDVTIKYDYLIKEWEREEIFWVELGIQSVLEALYSKVQIQDCAGEHWVLVV